MYNFEKKATELASRSYKTIITKVIDEDEVYFIAYNEEFGKFSCRGEGTTPEAALKNLELERLDLISILLEKGKPIPDPLPDEYEILFSGKFPVRTSPEIHKRLINEAKRMNISLNLLVNQLLSQNLTCREIEHSINERLNRTESMININLQKIESIQRYDMKTENPVLRKSTSGKMVLFKADNEETKYPLAS